MTNVELDPDGKRWQARVLRWRRLSSRWRPGMAIVGIIIGVLVGTIIGRTTAPSTDVESAEVIERRLLPLVLDADGIWTSASGERPPVADGLVALRTDGNPTVTRGWASSWLASYDSILVQLAGVDVPPSARSVQRQFIAAVTMSRDAIEVLAYAASGHDDDVIRDLTTEVGRLRQRSEQMVQAARASVSDLRGQRADVGLPTPVTPLSGNRR